MGGYIGLRNSGLRISTPTSSSPSNNNNNGHFNTMVFSAPLLTLLLLFLLFFLFLFFFLFLQSGSGVEATRWSISRLLSRCRFGSAILGPCPERVSPVSVSTSVSP